MKVLTVVSHPRTNSFTFAIANRFEQGLKDAGHETEILDLHRSGFNPVLWEEDEPDWSNENKRYSPEVETEIERMKRHEGLAYIFPIWWYSMPAMLKGYLDRVWNHGFAYGGSNHLHHKQILWLGLAGASAEHFEKREYDKMMRRNLNVGFANYAGIDNSKVEILYETLAKQEHREELLNQAYKLGLSYSNLNGDTD